LDYGRTEGVVTTRTGEDGDVGEASRALMELLAEVGFQKVASLVSVDEDAVCVIVTLSASQTYDLAALIAKSRK
jgi:hypothetical protein